MPRSARHANLETRTGRARLRMRRAPYFVKIAKGLRLGYYRGTTAGTWIGRRYLGNGSYETDALGLADDTTEADEVTVLDYWQAQEAVRRWAERSDYKQTSVQLKQIERSKKLGLSPPVQITSTGFDYALRVLFDVFQHPIG